GLSHRARRGPFPRRRRSGTSPEVVCPNPALLRSARVARLGAGEFVGRGVELAAIRDAFDRAVGGRGGLVLLVGGPGIGKTRLADELVVYARRAGALPLWGRVWEGAGAPALWPWVQILRGWLEACDPVRHRGDLAGAEGVVAHLVPELAERLDGLA